jgi:hypothetical protein
MQRAWIRQRCLCINSPYVADRKSELNGLGGYVLLDALDTKSVEKLIGDIITADFRLSEKDI